MKKETAIIIFYILYFTWLLTIVYLVNNIVLINYFTIMVALFYFFFLQEEWDYLWFGLGVVSAFLIVMSTFYNGVFQINLNALTEIPIWLPISWGTTFVALRKFFIIISTREDKKSVYY